MPSIIRKVLAQGKSNPIVARTIIQSETFLDLFPIQEETKARIFSININLCQRLLSMEDFVTWLTKECNTIKNDFISNGLKQNGDDAFEAPYVIDLDNRSESYLQTAKLCIRDCGMIFGALVGQKFDHKYHQIVKWAEGKYGKQDKYVQWLEEQSSWVKSLLDMRNALEHPKDAIRGQLQIRNVEFSFTEKGVSAEAPNWFLAGQPPTAILIDTQNINTKILSLSEDLIAATALKLFPEIPIAIQEIPEERRDSKCPIRLEWVPRDYFGST